MNNPADLPGGVVAPGWHQEFGQITVLRQIAYMANHEQTHLPEIEALRNQIMGQR